jgi:hypothetical protein
MSLLATDAARLENFFIFLPYFLISPIQSIFIIYIMIEKVDKSFLSGLFLLLLFIPIQSILGKVYDFIKYVLFSYIF